jgi:hypothetical protein
MKLEIEIPDSILRDAVTSAWQRSLTCDYGSGGGEAYRSIVAQISNYIHSQEFVVDMINAIKQSSHALVPGIVREAVVDELRKQAKRIVKEEVKAQTLLQM